MMRKLAVAWLLAVAAFAQEPVRTTVGIPALVTAVVLEGSEFEPVETTLASKVVLRIEHMQQHGTARRYAIQFTGFEKGEYDLAQFLRRKDRTDNGPMPKIPVIIDAALGAEQNEPRALDPIAAPDLGGYARTMWTLGIAWAVGLVAILFAFRKRRSATVVAAPQPTLADRLRPVVARALQGTLEPEGRAELERLLLSFWRKRLALESTPAQQAIAMMRAHAEAGALLRALEQWLHRKQPEPIDIEALLSPYAQVRDEDSGGDA